MDSRGKRLLAFADSGPDLSDRDDSIVIVDATTGREIHRLTGGYHEMAFSPDGKRLAAARTITERVTPDQVVDVFEIASLPGPKPTR